MYLLDTNVISEFRRPDRADRHVRTWSASLPKTAMFLSVATVEEIEIGVLRIERRDPTQGGAFRTWWEDTLVSFEGRILLQDTTIALRSARLQVPDPRPVRDSIIAATALVHGMIVVTRNVSDFLPTGVRILNPFDANPKVISA